MSPAMRQPWLRSTISVMAGSASRTAATAAMVSSRRGRVDAQLHAPAVPSSELLRDLDSAQRIEKRARRRVDRQPVGDAAEEASDGHPVDLAGDVPERRLERPRAGAVEGNRLERPDVAADGERIVPTNSCEVGLETVHGVAGPDAAHTLVGVDEDERRCEPPPGNGVPGGRERRIEGKLEVDELDTRDLHGDR